LTSKGAPRVTLHLLKSPVSPLAAETIRAPGQSVPVVAVLLSSGRDTRPLTGIKYYRVTESSLGLPANQDRETISYAQLIDMIFSAEKVIAW